MPAAEPTPPAGVTRIARRRARPGHEEAYEGLVRSMFERMAARPGFRGADLIPPDEPGGDYQVVVRFTSEESLAAWDESAERATVHAQMREHAFGEPDHRRLSGLEAWFAPPVVPASMHPPRHRMALVTWLGIWPTASLFIFFVAPILTGWGWPFLLVTAVNTILITVCMTYLVMPRLTRAFRPFLSGARRSRS